MSFFVKACVIGLKNYPAINAEIQGDEIVYKNYYNISIAVGTDRGLVVPVLRETDEMSFADIEKKLVNLVKKHEMEKLQLRTYKVELYNYKWRNIWINVINSNIKSSSVCCIRYAQYCPKTSCCKWQC